MVTVYVMDRSTATLAWYTGVMGAYDRSNLAGKVGQIVQRLCRVQFRHVPFYAACYIELVLQFHGLSNDGDENFSVSHLQ